MALHLFSSFQVNCTAAVDSLCEANLWIWRIVPPLLVFIGTFGNTTTLAVLCRKALRSKPMSILGALAVFDQLFLWSNIPLLYRWNAFPEHVISTAGTMRFLTYVMVFARSASNWTVAVFTVERVSAILFPFITKTYLTSKKTRVTVTILTVAQGIYLAFVTFGYKKLFSADNDEKTVNTTTECPNFSPDLGEYCATHRVIAGFTGIFVPLTIAVVGNIILIVKFLCCKPSTWRDSRPDAQTKMLFAITGFLFASMVSFVIGMALRDYLIQSGNDVDVSTLLMVLVYNIQLTNHSINFFLYLGTSSLFQAEFNLMCTEITGKIMCR